MSRRRLRMAACALVACVYIVAAPTVASRLLSSAFRCVSYVIGGADLVRQVFAFLISHMSIYQILAYALFGAPVVVWLHRMRASAASAAPTSAAQAPSDADEDGDHAVAWDQDTGVPAPPDGDERVTEPESEPAELIQAPGVTRPAERVPYATILMLALATQWLSVAFLTIVSIFAPEQMSAYNESLEGTSVTESGLAMIIAVVIMPALIEEMAFRGVIMTYLRRAGAPFALANALQAIAFGIYHLNPLQSCYTVLAGLQAGFLTHRFGSLVPSMWFHACYNVLGSVLNSILYALIWSRLVRAARIAAWIVGGIALIVWAVRSMGPASAARTVPPAAGAADTPTAANAADAADTSDAPH